MKTDLSGKEHLVWNLVLCACMVIETKWILLGLWVGQVPVGFLIACVIIRANPLKMLWDLGQWASSSELRREFKEFRKWRRSQ